MASSNTRPSTSFDRKFSDAALLNAKLLKPFDEVLRCRICFDYFTNCMMTKCNHNYCSVCIRRYMNYKSQCPTCFKEATEPELQNNRLVDEILRIYKKYREALQISSDSINKQPFPEQSRSCKSVVNDNLQKSSKPETINASQSKHQTTEVSTLDEVSCPVCYTTVPNNRINIHLDTCLKQSEEKNQRKFLPKLVYHLLSDKEIKKKLNEHGLSTTGTRQALIRRHKNFITLYNANCDSLNPKHVSDLVLEIERQELEERVNALQRSAQVNKKSDPSLIEKEHESYIEEHKSQFNTLIQDVQEREFGKKFIKEEFEVEDVCNITDESGKVIGESTLKIGNPSNSDDPVIVKEEHFSESFEESFLPDIADDSTVGNDDIVYKDYNKLSFRIKKELPWGKNKESPSLLGATTNVESPSLDPCETTKTLEIPCVADVDLSREMEFMYSEKKRKLVVLKGYKFYKTRETQKGWKWRCVKSKCRAKLYLDRTSTMILKSDLQHNHEKEKNLKRQAISNSIKQKAVEQFTERPQKLIKKEISNVPSQYAMEINKQDIECIRKNIYRARHSVQSSLTRNAKTDDILITGN